MKTHICIAVGVVAVALSIAATASAQSKPTPPVTPVAPAAPVAPVAPVAPIATPQSGAVAAAATEARQAARDASREVARAAAQARMTGAGREQALYSAATSAMDASQWPKALELFSQVIGLKGSRQDGAMYWKAYVQNKLGQRPEALTTIQELVRSQPSSRWISDARALEIEIKNASGQPVKPEAESDDELKLLALNGLMTTDSDQAIAILQKLLQGPQSRKVKQRALFVLSQSRTPKAREVLVSIAKGGGNPDLQREAVNYLGMSHAKENSQVLAEIYASRVDNDVKQRVLQAFMMSGDRDRLVAAAKGEPDVAMRSEAVRLLGAMRAADALGQMYASESNLEVKRELVRALMVAGDNSVLMKVASSDADPKMRVEAVRMLGAMGRGKNTTTLADIYSAPSQSVEVRKAVIGSLRMQGDAKVLVDLARKETDKELRKEFVQVLSTMKSKEATDFLMELINK